MVEAIGMPIVNLKTLKFTGHYWEHEWPNMRPGGDNMAMYAWPQVPAIDMLFKSMGMTLQPMPSLGI